MTTNNGGPAFSGYELREDKITVREPDGTEHEHGCGYKSAHFVTGQLSVLDYFAAKAFQSAMAGASGLGSLSKDERTQMLDAVAGICYEAADAMLAERERKTNA